MNLPEILLSYLTFISFVITVFLTALIKRYVDPKKVREHPDIQTLFVTQLLPKEMLTASGQRLWILRNVAFVVTLVCVVVIVVWQQFLK